MKVTILNQAMLVGDYDGEALTTESSIAETTLVEGLSANKSASKTLWTGGTMTYTIVVTNDTTIDYLAPTFTDVLDSHITYVADSFKVDGVATAASFTAQTLTATLSTIAAGESITITFDVEQVQP